MFYDQTGPTTGFATVILRYLLPYNPECRIIHRYSAIIRHLPASAKAIYGHRSDSFDPLPTINTRSATFSSLATEKADPAAPVSTLASTL